MNIIINSDDGPKRRPYVRSGSTDLKLFVKDIHDSDSKKMQLQVRTWSSVKDIKDLLHKKTGIPPSSQRLYFGPLMSKSVDVVKNFKGAGAELQNHRTLSETGIYKSGQILFLDVQPKNNSLSMSMLHAHSDLCIAASMMDCCPKKMRNIVLKARQGLSTGLKPELGIDGTGGTYFLRDTGKNKVAVFKPADEEPYAENNPRGYLRSGNDELLIRDGISPGEACLREVAAYLLDHDGFSGVPSTTLALARHPAFNVNGSHLRVNEGGASLGPHSLFSTPSTAAMAQTLGSSATCLENLTATSLVSGGERLNCNNYQPLNKIGSCQEFVYSECTMDDISPSKISVDEVHKIAILDIRLMNADRNSANLLVRRRRDNSLELIPIDHGLCLRTCCDVAWFDWCWIDWPQLKQPVSQATRDYILGLDIDSDCQVLEERLHLSTEVLDIYRASTKLLQEGIKADLTLYDIGMLCSRTDDMGDVESRLETMMSSADDLALSALKNDRWGHVAASRALEDQLYTDHSSLLRKHSSNIMTKCTSMSLLATSTQSPKSKMNASNIMIPEEDDIYMSDSAFDFSVQTSGSDSSFCTDSSDFGCFDEECSEWAANVIKNVSADKLETHLSKMSINKRHESFDDSSTLSTSPKGFWYTSPESAMKNAGMSDDVEDIIKWSPSTSPAAGVLNSVLSASPSPVFRMLSREDNPRLVVPIVKPVKNKMVRAKSYSAFHSFDSKTDMSASGNKKNSISGGTKKQPRRDDEKYRKYFSKFVDLLITRETLSSIRQRKLSMNLEIDDDQKSSGFDTVGFVFE